jgi:hypothetical protein
MFLSSTCAHCLVISKYTSGELIMICGILFYGCFPFKINELRSVGFLGEYAGSLGLFRTREYVWGSLDHFGA